MSFLTVNAGDIQHGVNTVTLFPDAALITSLDAIKAAGGNIVGRFLKFAEAANMTCSLCADTNNPELIVTEVPEEDPTYSYGLTCKIIGYTDYEGTYHAGGQVWAFDYNGSPALGEEVRVESSGSDYVAVESTQASGVGTVIGIDIPASGQLVCVI